MADAVSDLRQSVDWTSAGRSLAATKADLNDLVQFDLLGYPISHLARDRWSEAMSAVDLDHLDRVSQGEFGTARCRRRRRQLPQSTPRRAAPRY